MGRNRPRFAAHPIGYGTREDPNTVAEYLDNTVAHLDAEGIHDKRLHRLQQRVTQWRN